MSILKKIKIINFIRLAEEGVDLNMVYLLSLLQESYDISSFKSEKIQGWVYSLLRKGLITEDYKLTLEGMNALMMVEQDIGKSTLKKIAVDSSSEFLRFWEIYPATDNFEFNNRKFPGGRKMRIKQKECEVMFNKLINEEGFKAEDIIQGTINHLEILKRLSYSEKKNKLTYTPASDRYLKEKYFSPYIGKGEEKPIEKDFEI